MSKKSSPGAGPTRRNSSRLDAQSMVSISRPGGGLRRTGTRPIEPEIEPEDPTLRTRLRTYLPVALLPNGVIVALIIALSIITILVANVPMAALPTAIAQSWLSVNAAPIAIHNYHFGVMPLLLTMILIAAVAQRVHRAVKDRVSLADLSVIAAVVLGISTLLTLTALAMLWDASEVFQVAPPNVAVAVGKTLLVHLIALVLGMGVRLWKALAKRFNIAESLIDQAVSALWVLGYALLGAAVVLVASLIMHAGAVGQILQNYTGGGKAAVILVSIGYFPNAVISTLAVTSGSEVVIGYGLVSAFGVNGVPLPPVPLFAAFPAQVHTYMAALLVVPAFATVLALMKRVPRLVDLPGFVFFVALYSLMLTNLTQGDMGVYGFMGPRALLTAGFMAGWAFVVGLIIAIVGGQVQKRLAAALLVDDNIPTSEEVEEVKPDEEAADGPEASDEEEEPAEAETAATEAVDDDLPAESEPEADPKVSEEAEPETPEAPDVEVVTEVEEDLIAELTEATEVEPSGEKN